MDNAKPYKKMQKSTMKAKILSTFLQTGEHGKKMYLKWGKKVTMNLIITLRNMGSKNAWRKKSILRQL